MPVKALYPKRGEFLLTLFLSLLVAYGIGWLIIAGVESTQSEDASGTTISGKPLQQRVRHHRSPSGTLRLAEILLVGPKANYPNAVPDTIAATPHLLELVILMRPLSNFDPEKLQTTLSPS